MQETATAVPIRNPWVVGLLTFFTFGFYGAFWWYRSACEIRSISKPCGVDMEFNPILSLAAVTIGWIVLIPPFIELHRGYSRVLDLQRAIGMEKSVFDPFGFVSLTIFLLPVGLAHLQREINRIVMFMADPTAIQNPRVIR